MRVAVGSGALGAWVLVTALTIAWLAANGYQTFATPYCSSGAVNVTTASQLVSAVENDQDVCVTAELTQEVFLLHVGPDEVTGTGDVVEGSSTITNVTGDFEVGMRLEGEGLDYRGRATGRTRITAIDGDTLTIAPAANSTVEGAELRAADDIEIGTSDGGYVRHIELDGSAWVTIHARVGSLRIDESEDVLVDNSVVGGTEDDLLFTPALVAMLSASEDVVLSNNDIGFTTTCTDPGDPETCDQGGDVGYGVRAYGVNDRMHFTGNKIHHIAADGMQGFGGEDVLIDRNEIGPVGPNEGSEEHSDNIQVTGFGDGMEITDNWIHHQGYFGDVISGNSGTIYVHGKESVEDGSSLLIENNLIEHSRGRVEVCGLGTPDPPDIQNNVVVRNNTIRDQGQAFPDFPGFEWDCTVGTGNVIERNVFVDPDGGWDLHDAGPPHVTISDNIAGTEDLVTLDEDANCTSSSCNPVDGPHIGYRKPSGVNW